MKNDHLQLTDAIQKVNALLSVSDSKEEAGAATEKTIARAKTENNKIPLVKSTPTATATTVVSRKASAVVDILAPVRQK